jgi:hypothetical protein
MKELAAHSSKVAGLKGDNALRDEKHATLEERLEALERKHQDSSDSCFRKLSTLEAGHNDHKLKSRDANAKAEQQRHLLDSHKMTVEQRLEQIETIMTESTGGKFSEFTKDLDKRLHYMQEDQKRARDVLESSLQEQLHLEHSLLDDNSRQMKEHWERELRARQAYQEQNKNLLQTERSSREALEHETEQRVSTLERTMGLETNRLWVAIDKHTHDAKEPIILPPQQIVEIMTQRPRLPSTVVDVVDTHGHHHLEAMTSRSISSGHLVSGSMPQHYVGGTQRQQLQQTDRASFPQVMPSMPRSPTMMTRTMLP